MASDLDCPGAQERGQGPIREATMFDCTPVTELKSPCCSAPYSLSLDRDNIQPFFGLIPNGY